MKIKSLCFRGVGSLVGMSMILSLVACGSTNGNTQASNETGADQSSNNATIFNDTSAESETIDAASETSGNSNLETITVLCMNDFSSEVKVNDWEKYDVSKVFSKELADRGIRLEVEGIDNDSFQNVVTTRLASGTDVPDVIAYCWDANGPTKVTQWAQNGLIMAASDLCDKYDTDDSIRKYYDEKCPGAWASNLAPDGKEYWFSYLAHTHYIDSANMEEYIDYHPVTLLIREDWVEKVGEKIKDVYTPDELFDLLKKIRDNDANGNGVEDEVIAIPIDTFKNGIAAAYGLEQFGIIDGFYSNDNKVFSNFEHENFKDYIEFMKKLYDNGLYDTASLGDTQMFSQTVSENKASLAYNYCDWGDFEKQIATDENAEYLPIILNTSSDLSEGFHIFADGMSTTYNQYFVTSSCKNPEAVMKLFDYIYSDDYAILDCVGQEGVNYDIEDGYVKPRNINTSDDPIKYTNLFGTGIGLYALPTVNTVTTLNDRWDFSQLDDYMVPKMEFRKRFCENYVKNCTFEWGSTANYAIPTDEERTFDEEHVAELQTYCQELLSDLILGRKSIDDLDKDIEEMKKLGLDQKIKYDQNRRDRVVEATQ